MKNGLYQIITVFISVRAHHKKSSKFLSFADNEEIQIVYAEGLVNFVRKDKSSERKETIDKLRYFAELHIDNLDIQTIFEEVIGEL